MDATTGTAIYAAAVATTGFGWQVVTWLRSEAATKRRHEGAAIGAVLAALDDLLVATGQAHGERIDRIMAHGSDKPVREIWRPDRQLTVEADQQLAKATTTVIRLGQQVEDEDLREVAANAVEFSERAVKGATLDEARESADGLAILVMSTHVAKGVKVRG